MAKKTEKTENTSEKVNEFMTKNRKVIIIVCAVVVVAAAAAGIVATVLGSIQKKNLAAIDVIEYKYTSDANTAETLEAIEAYTAKAGVSGVRANMLKAGVLFEESKFAEAAEAYLKAAELSKANYTGAYCYYNAATCFDEASDYAKAAEFYQKSIDAKVDVAPHAYFNLGRVQESLNNKEAALAAYQAIIDNFPGDNWNLLAHSRIIALNAE